MAKFNKGDKVSYKGSSVYTGTKAGKATYTENADSGTGTCVKSTSSGVIVQKENGNKEFVHRNRIK